MHNVAFSVLPAIMLNGPEDGGPAIGTSKSVIFDAARTEPAFFSLNTTETLRFTIGTNTIAQVGVNSIMMFQIRQGSLPCSKIVRETANKRADFLSETESDLPAHFLTPL